MAFPKDFLDNIAREKNLTQKEVEVFLALFGESKSRSQIAEELHIVESVVATRLTGVYQKFSIGGKGPVKESRLKDYLTNKYKYWESDNSHQDSSNIDSAELSIDALVRELRQKYSLISRKSAARCGCWI